MTSPTSKMCASNLSELFKTSLAQFPGDKPALVFTVFENAVRAKKYDVQDTAIIEAVLKEESDTLKESFTVAFGDHLNRNGGEWNGEKSEKAAELFLASLESLVNYYYSNTIAGQFS